jgi:hypothetical protein
VQENFFSVFSIASSVQENFFLVFFYRFISEGKLFFGFFYRFIGAGKLFSFFSIASSVQENFLSVFSIASSVKKILPNKIVMLYSIFFSKIVFWYRFNRYIFEYRCPSLTTCPLWSIELSRLSMLARNVFPTGLVTTVLPLAWWLALQEQALLQRRQAVG